MDKSCRSVNVTERWFLASVHGFFGVVRTCLGVVRMQRPVPGFSMIAFETKGMDTLDLLVDIEKMETHLTMFYCQQEYHIKMFHSNSCCTCQTAGEAE